MLRLHGIGWDSRRYSETVVASRVSRDAVTFGLDVSVRAEDDDVVERKIKGRPPRLPVVFHSSSAPLYLLTFCTLLRRPILAAPEIHAAFQQYAVRGRDFNIAVGRYVIMPDHVHAFVCFGGDVGIEQWTRGLKRVLEVELRGAGQKPVSVGDSVLKSFWQPGVFDHLLRHDESYGKKWEYVWRNPVRAGLVTTPEAWPYQGEIVVIDRV